MKKIFVFLVVSLILCNGCKYFRKPTARSVDTISADTAMQNEGISDSTNIYSGTDETNAAVSQSATRVTSGNNKYYMIVGCFVVPSNADTYVQKLRGMGYEAEIILGPSNFQMVAARSYNSYSASVGELEKFRNEVTPNAWVYRNR